MKTITEFNRVENCPNCWGYQQYNGKESNVERTIRICLGWISKYSERMLGIK